MTASVEFKQHYNNVKYSNNGYNRSYRHRKAMLNQRNYLFISILLVVIGIIVLLTSSFSVAAENNDSEPTYKYYTSVQITEGDSLWGIATEYADLNYYDNYEEYIAEVISMNHIIDETIHVGQYLMIPYHSSDYK